MPPRKNGRLKVGVVGAGIAHSADGRENFAVRAHLPALKALSDLYEVTAVCTTRMESAREAAERFGVPHAFDGVEKMLRGVPDIDVVCVSVRPVSHYQVAMPALEAGKHVYCEHPGGVSTEQAKAMWELAQRKGVRTMTGHQAHFDPARVHMGELVRSGYVGTPIAIGMSHFGSNYIAPRPYFHRWLFEAEGGGVRPAYRSGHSFQQLMGVLGEDVKSVCADFTIQVPERPALDRDVVIHSNQVDNMNYLLRVGERAVGALQVCNTAWFGTGERFELYGTDGMLVLTSTPMVAPAAPTTGAPSVPKAGSHHETRLYGARADVKRVLEEKLPPERLQGYFEEIPVPEPSFSVALKESSPAYGVARAWSEFAEAIREGRDRSPNLYDTYRIHRIWDAGEESVRKRGWVDVDYR